MQSRLPLKLDKDIIQDAIEYAKNMNISLSKMVENYFKAVLKIKNPKKTTQSSLVDQLSGIISLDSQATHKDQQVEYLMKKYS